MSKLLFVVLGIIVITASVAAQANFWGNFTELGSASLPTNYNSISAMAVDDTTSPATGYFTAFRDSISTAKLFKFYLDESKIVDEVSLTAGTGNPVVMTMDTTYKMLYYVPYNQQIIVKYDPVNKVEIDRLDLTKPPHFITSLINGAVFDKPNRTIVYSLNENPARLIRLDLNTFNLTGSPLTFNNASFLGVGALNAKTNMAYFGANTYPAAVVQIDLVKWEFVKALTLYEEYYGFPIAMISIAGVAMDEVNDVVYFSDTQDPGRIAKIKLSPSMNQIGTLRLSVGERSPAVLLLDQIGGNMIVGCDQVIEEAYNTPERVVQVDLRLFRRVASIETRDYEVSLRSGVIDPVTRTAFFGTNRQVNYFAWPDGPDHLIRVTVPAPCGGDVSCSGHGVCNYGACQCSGGVSARQVWSGEVCDTLSCPTFESSKVCSGNGLCNNGTCICTTDAQGHTAFGDDCHNVTCPNKCTGHGTCDTATLCCACLNGWKGADCSIAVPPRPPCHELLNCSMCFKDPSCGWCESGVNGSKCMDGTFVGPSTCYDWHYDSCPDSSLFVISVILVVITCILLVVGGVSAVRDDQAWVTVEDDQDSRNKKKMLSRVSWWRGSRTLKAWWMVDRLQMAALVGIVGSPIPSVYFSFIKPYMWTLFGVTAPGFVVQALNSMVPPPALQLRGLLSMPQYAAELQVTATIGNAIAIFGTAVFYFAVVFGGVLVILLIATVVAFFLGWTEGSASAPATLPYRIPGILLRIVLFSYTGLIATASAAAFAQSQNVSMSPGIFGLSLVILLVFGLVFPALNLFLFMSKAVQKKQFQRKFRMMLGCLYENYYFKRAWFGSVYLWKKFFVALIIGVFSQTSGTAGLACAVIIMVTAIAYAVAILFLKPFLDPMMRNLEILGAGADVFTGICIFFFSPSMGLVGVADEAEFSKRNNIAMILIIVQIVWIVFGAFAYFENWLRVHNVHSYGQLFKKIVGMRKKADISGPVAVPMGNVQSTHHLD